MPRAIDYDLLKTFLEAAAAGSFSGAAHRRGVSPSAVSQQIGTLEGQLGAPLFERVGGGVRLSEMGRRLHRVVAAYFERIDDALDEVVDDFVTLRGRVRIGGSGPFAKTWLAQRLPALIEALPNVELVTTFDTAAAIDQKLLDGSLDLGVVFRKLPYRSFEGVQIATETWLAAAAPSYLSRVDRPRRAEDFRQHPFISHGPSRPHLRIWWSAHFGRREPMPERVVCHIDDYSQILALTRRGLGLAVFPDHVVSDAIAAKELIPLAPGGAKAARRPPPTGPVYLTWSKKSLQTARTNAVREALLAPPRSQPATRRRRR
jgi:DNA-binding transcriptional LysR family regulator